MLERDEFMAKIRDRLEQAQQYSKQQYDKKHRELSFEVGQWVWLRLLHCPMASLNVQGRSKLGPRYFGPYRIAEKIGDVARLHNVFHVGLLKIFHGTSSTSTSSEWKGLSSPGQRIEGVPRSR